MAFASLASNLVAGDPNGTRDVFLKDTQTGVIQRISTAGDGTQGNNDSEGASLSADGRYVAFRSDASNLVAGDTNGASDIFLKDTQTGSIQRLSTAVDGTQGISGGYDASVSADGRYVAFQSSASNLVAGDGNNTQDIFLAANGTVGLDRVESTVSYTLPELVENLILTGAASVSGTGNVLNNRLNGNSGDNVLDGGWGDDTLDGGAGVDTASYAASLSSVTAHLGMGQSSGGEGNDVLLNIENLTGSAYNDTLSGNGAANRLDGGSGDDTLEGGDGADTLIGGDGLDTASYADASAAVTVDLSVLTAQNTQGAGVDVLAGFENLAGSSHADNLMGDAADNVLSGADGNDTLDGGTGNDRLYGGGGNDTLLAVPGLDTLEGGAGDDVYSIDGSAKVLVEQAGGGNDTVRINFDFNPGVLPIYALPDNFENLELGGLFAQQAIGNSLDNRLTGNAGNNVLDGGAGTDTMLGGEGDDKYIVDNIGDVVIESISEGTDIVRSSVTYTLPANVENLILTGTGNIDGTGNNLDNQIGGNSGNNILDGKAGADILDGGLGDDIYKVDNLGDQVQENAGGGLDRIDTSVSYVLPDNVENGTLLALANMNATTGRLNITGNDLPNYLVGNDFNNVIDGKGGADTMVGGKGDDTYYVDNTLDVVIELPNQGTDLVNTTVTLTQLYANVENLTLLEGFHTNAIGNTENNVLTGNSADNRIEGDGGIDTASYVQALSGVTVSLFVQGDLNHDGQDDAQNTGGGGTDTLTSIENLTGSAFNDHLTGDNGDNTVDGGAGDDEITGGSGAGNDLYLGGDGNDTVKYSSATASITVDLLGGWAYGSDIGNDTLLSIENLIGGAGNDILRGDANANRLEGGAGDDSFTGGGGRDTLVGGTGRDAYLTDDRDIAPLTVTDFTAGTGGDLIDLNTPLSHALGYAGGDPRAAGYVRAIQDTVTTADTLIQFDADAAGTSYGWKDLARLQNVTASTLTTDNYRYPTAATTTPSGGTSGGGGTTTSGGTSGGGGGTPTPNPPPANNPPTASGGSVSGPQDGVYTFQSTDFGFRDADADAGQSLQAVKIVSLPGKGSLTVNGAPVALGQTVGIGPIAAGLLQFLPAPGTFGAGYVSFGFQVSDGQALSSGSATLSVNIAQGSGNNGEDDKTLSGDLKNNTLTGGGGNDTLQGLAGNDTLQGGADADTASYAAASAAVVVNLTLTAAQNTVGAGSDLLKDLENLTGSKFNDKLTGNAQDNTLQGGAGNDTLDGGAGDDTLDGGLGQDTARYASAASAVSVNLGLIAAQNTQGAGSDLLKGIEHLQGSDFNDKLTGNALNNRLEGGDGNDTLVGGLGNDTLVGGDGADSLTGGAGNDVFRFVTAGEGIDTLTDFTTKQDKIQVVSANFGDLAVGVLSAGNFVLNGAASGAIPTFLYDSATGALKFDLDGSGEGAAVQIATLTGPKTLAASDIQIVGG